MVSYIQGFRISGFRVSGFRFQVSGFRLQGFRVSGFQGSGFRVFGVSEVRGFRVFLELKLVESARRYMWARWTSH